MPVFNDSNNIPPVLPDGDYIFCVSNFEIGISQGQKTRGSDQYEVELEIEPSGKKVTERLIDHASCAWKIDCFLKSAGVKLAKGQAFDFRKDIADKQGIVWVNPMGLRGWCALTQRALPGKTDEDRKAIAAGTKKPLVVNEVVVFYTDKPKLEKRHEKPELEEDTPF